MRVGCCTNMVAAYPDGTGIEHIKTLKDAGYDYIELPLAQMMELSDKEFNILKDRVYSSGINCEACNNFFPAKIRLTGNEVKQNEIERYVNAAVDRASQLGVKVIVFGSSGAKNVPPGFPANKAWKQIVKVLRDINEIVKPRGITIVIEHLNRSESNIVNTVSEAYKLANEVDRENIRLLVDYYHLIKEFDDPGVLAGMGECIRHIHFARPEGRTFPGWTDSDNYGIFFDCLKEIRYAGRISIEAYTDEFYKDAKKSLDFLRVLMQS